MPHAHSGSHPVRRQIGLSIVVAALLAILALLLLPPRAHGNFVYWTNSSIPGSVGRAKINGTGLNDNFIPNLDAPQGVAVNSQFIFWAEQGANRIGKANLDGSGVTPGFIGTGAAPSGVAVNSGGIFWGINAAAGVATIGHAGFGGGPSDIPIDNFITLPGANHFLCGIAADQNFVYWLDTGGGVSRIGRAPAGGGPATTDFIPLTGAGCGVAVDPSFIYWGAANKSIGRAPVGGGAPDESFIPGAATGTVNPFGVAVNAQYVFWANRAAAIGTSAIGRANIGGGSPNSSLIPGVGLPYLLAAAPSNKITINSIAKKKKKGTAIIDAKVPGPGQVTLNQVSTPPDVNATEAAVKQIGLTITQASSFQLPVKPVGKTAKMLSKQIKKQLRKKRKAKAKAKQTVFIHFVPAGVAGVPNTEQVSVTLVKTKSKKK